MKFVREKRIYQKTRKFVPTKSDMKKGKKINVGSEGMNIGPALEKIFDQNIKGTISDTFKTVEAEIRKRAEAEKQ